MKISFFIVLRYNKNMIYDITQPLFECEVYPGDMSPQKIEVESMEKGSSYNLSNVMMCVHNGTHVDAPLHFIKEGKGIDEIPLEKFVGLAYVVSHDGDVLKEDAYNILDRVKGCKKILIKYLGSIYLHTRG